VAKAQHPRPESLLQAAVERSQDAIELFDNDRHAASIWVSGVALECLFRAYHRLHSDQLNTGHSIMNLYKDSRFARSISPARSEDMAEKIGFVAVIWKHRFRYDPESKIKASAGLTGSQDLTRIARRTVNATRAVVNHGETRWPRAT